MADTVLQSISDFIAGGLLKGYDALNDRQNLPSNQRLYLSTVIDKNKQPITNKDFTQKELDLIQKLISQKGGEAGAIKYQDYPVAKEGESALARPLSGNELPYENIRTSLGQFTYKLDPKTNSYVVSDVYDFNANPLTKDVVQGDYAGRFAISPYLMARAYGQSVIPVGSGRQVSLTVPGLLDVKKKSK
jgi:hypothetical protein